MTRFRTRVAVLAGLTAALVSFPALPLGLGEITLDSALNEPLDARIELLQLDGLDENQIRVALGAPEDFARAGIEFPPFLSQITFEVEILSRDSGVLRLTSTAPVVEPYLNFLVDTRWPSGRLLREYTVLLDLPTFAATNASPAPVQAPRVTPAPEPEPRPAPIVATETPVSPPPAATSVESAAELQEEPQEGLEAARAGPGADEQSQFPEPDVVQPEPSESDIAQAEPPEPENIQTGPSEPDTAQPEAPEPEIIPEEPSEPDIATQDDTDITEPAEPEETAAPNPPALAEEAAPAPPPAQTAAAPVGQGVAAEEDETPEIITTQTNDTLWEIALSTRPDDSVSVQQMMLAIQRTNPDAFINGNINGLRAGRVLRIPDVDEILAFNRQQALDQVALQNQQFTASQNLPGEPLASGAGGGNTGGEDTAADELRVLTGDDVDSGAGSEDLSAVIESLENELMLSEENLDRARIENQELVSRLTNLEAQIDTLKNIIAIEDQRLARLQADLATQAAQAQQAAAAPAPTPTPASPGPPSDSGFMGQLGGLLENTLVMISSLTVLVLLVLSFLIWRRKQAEGLTEDDFEPAAAPLAPDVALEAGAAGESSAWPGTEEVGSEEVEESIASPEPVVAASEPAGQTMEDEAASVDETAFAPDSDEPDLEEILGDFDLEEVSPEQDSEKQVSSEEALQEASPDESSHAETPTAAEEPGADATDAAKNAGVLNSLRTLMSRFAQKHKEDEKEPTAGDDSLISDGLMDDLEETGLSEDPQDRVSRPEDQAEELKEVQDQVPEPDHQAEEPAAEPDDEPQEGVAAFQETPEEGEIEEAAGAAPVTPDEAEENRQDDDDLLEFRLDDVTGVEASEDTAPAGSAGEDQDEIETFEFTVAEPPAEEKTAGDEGTEPEIEYETIAAPESGEAAEPPTAGAASSESEDDLEWEVEFEDVDEADEGDSGQSEGAAEVKTEEEETEAAPEAKAAVEEETEAEEEKAEPEDLDIPDLGNLDIDENLLAGAEEEEEAEPQSLSDRDEVSTKLDLAVAYEAMGDLDGAREILNEVLEEGNEEPIAEARRLLETWGKPEGSE